jgi:phosphatidylglycerol lysyltransferase
LHRSIVDLTRSRLQHASTIGRFDVADAHERVARARLMELLDEHATLAGQSHALSRDDWRLLFACGRDVVIPFQERRFAIVAWRDPIGGVDRTEALRNLAAYGKASGKHVIALAMSDDMRVVGERLGFASVWLGCEQVFDLDSFSTCGKPAEKLRLAVNHARREGLVVREVFPLDDDHAHAKILAVDTLWRRKHSARRTKSFLRTAPMENAHLRRYFVAERRGAMEAFIVCAPVSRRGWYLQDLVRRPDAARGATELVSLHALETFAAEGIRFATMGPVPFFDPIGTRSTASVGGAIGFCIKHFDGVFGFAGIRQFRAKFPATRLVPVHALLWPRALTPLAGWDLVRILA